MLGPRGTVMGGSHTGTESNSGRGPVKEVILGKVRVGVLCFVRKTTGA